MVVWELSLEEFLVGDVVGPTNETVSGILSALPDPPWKAGSETILVDNPKFATAAANGGRGQADQLLLEQANGGWSPVGCYVYEALLIDSRVRGKGLSTELILRCCAHREVPKSRKLSQAGRGALSRAHRVAVERAVNDGLRVPESVRREYGL